jgi:RHH-type transcriptional regulator, proline utilization regulon repressor / proline dehydrogenase / delta 1-pyrroline-5-carboxylate dehydrogenase
MCPSFLILYGPMTTLWDTIVENYRKDETACLRSLITHAKLTSEQNAQISTRAANLTTTVRKERAQHGGVNALIAEYGLSNEEGVALMCLAEALLRIPDALTQDRLIQDKVLTADWNKHLGASESLFVNAATFGLYITGKILKPEALYPKQLKNTLHNFMRRTSDTVLRNCIRYAMRILGNHFVMGESIEDAQKRAIKFEAQGYRYSYDMLGEAAYTDADAQLYLKDYENAILCVGKSHTDKPIFARANVSIKLSALHPRYTFTQEARMFNELYPRVKHLCLLAQEQGISLTIDAEEADRLLISLQIIEALAFEPELKTWQGLGLALQAYQKRAFYVLDLLKDIAQKSNRRLMLRLVKGAYWDSEIKWSQEQGIEYPVFTRKVYTDVSYIACVKKLLANTDVFYPMFATHNARTVATVLELAGNYKDYEFQCLHGMGATLYDQITNPNSEIQIPCRVYAPVGSHERLLAYLVRRLLENGANSSFVNHILDPEVSIEDMIRDPLAEAEAFGLQPHPYIPLPRNLYGDLRMNSQGLDLSNPHVLTQITNEMAAVSQEQWLAVPMIAGVNPEEGTEQAVFNPANLKEQIGHAIKADVKEVDIAITAAQQAFEKFSKTTAHERAQMLRRMADLIEDNMPRFMAIAIREAGKSISNAIGEVREAIDFCRYYAAECEQHFAEPQTFKSVTGEINQMVLRGRGIMVCISPWNFPLAIFLGQVTAALAAGNVVIAKPSEQTSLIAAFAVTLLHQAGFPRDVIQLALGKGSVIGSKLVSDPRIAGVIFTGSTETARFINTTLAQRNGPIAVLVAETGGQNAMVVDSSALTEQVVKDVIISSFDSAGQRCSALRVLFLQEDIADKTINMLKGAMDELTVANPIHINTDIGPVIDKKSQENLLKHIEAMRTTAKILHQAPLAPETKEGYFVPPTLIEIPNIQVLTQEVFGPVLHVIRYRADQLEDVVAQVNSTGYGLTFGIHSRIQKVIDYLSQNVRVGNIYVNRNIIGAIVGVQPFGGEGLSGTGPKAGGPHYLFRFATERTVTVNTAAAGGNASLIASSE